MAGPLIVLGFSDFSQWNYFRLDAEPCRYEGGEDARDRLSSRPRLLAPSALQPDPLSLPSHPLFHVLLLFRAPTFSCTPGAMPSARNTAEHLP